ncbi:hypothetical protein GF377_08425 [candidate division GN15 bacterium]|nr:hypothetical protein [candidate division GN15 bacterium]
MKFLRLVLAFVLTVLLLYVARSTSMGRPDTLAGSDGEYSFAITTVPKILENQTDRITLSVTGPTDSTRVWLRTTKMGKAQPEDLSSYTPVEMHPDGDLPDDTYGVFVEAGRRGGRFYYYFEVTDMERNRLATYTPEPGEPFLLKYIGTVPGWITGLHIFFIFATVFCISLATVHAGRVVFTGGDPKAMMKPMLWATALCFMGMIPFGVPMNYFAFDASWEGVPFGHDATDNKTQLLFVYLLFVTLAGRRYLTGRGGRTGWSRSAIGWFGLGSFAVMLFIYLIPHSIQFTPLFTYAFCYTWIGIVLALFLFGEIQSRQAPVSDPTPVRGEA